MDLRSNLPVWARQLVKPSSFHRNARRGLHVALRAVPDGLRVADKVRNWRWCSAPERFLVVRYPRKYPLFYEVILKWTAVNFPAERRRFELRTLPIEVADWSRFVLHLPWLQDPVLSWSRSVYDQANHLAAECARRTIAVINPVEATGNTTRVRAARLLNAAGVPMPAAIPVDDPAAFRDSLGGLRLPLFIREDCGHRNTFYRADTRADLTRVPWRRLRQPVATEIVDARDPRDGLYRKFRYIAVGGWGCLLHVQYSRDWITRGENMIINDQTRAEELEWLAAPDPNHDLLQSACRALGLDFAVFDYGYDSQGRLAVWEANPMPFLHFGSGRIAHRTTTMHRILAALLHLYLSRAGLPVPGRITDILAAGSQESGRVIEGLKAVR